VAGRLSTHRPPMMQSHWSKIDHFQNASEPKSDVPLAIHILATFLTAKVMTFQLINVGASTPLL
jgi:hypothetical protein